MKQATSAARHLRSRALIDLANSLKFLRQWPPQPISLITTPWQANTGDAIISEYSNIHMYEPPYEPPAYHCLQMPG
ncbi:hypothetical protein D3C81_2045430 [compost metagenome]